MKTVDDHLPRPMQIKSVLNFPILAYSKGLDGIYLSCNQAYATANNLPNSSFIVGKTDFDISTHESSLQRAKNDQLAIKSNKKMRFVEEFPNKNGGYERYDAIKEPFFDENNKITGLICLLTDCRDLASNLESQNMDSANKTDYINNMRYLQNIASLFPGNMYWKGLSGIYLGSNENQDKLFGMEIKTIKGKSVFELMSKEDAEQIDRVDTEVMRSGVAKIVQEQMTDNFGLKRTYLSSKMPLYDEEKHVLGMLGMSMNISERIEMEDALKKVKLQAEEANKRKSDFIMNMSHDMRTPFNAIIGFSDILLQTNQTNDNKMMINSILQSANRLLDIIDDFIDLVSSDVSEEIRLKLNINIFLKELFELLRPGANSKSLDLSMNIKSNVPKYIYGNQLALKRILINLVSNAIKFTESGVVVLTVDHILNPANDKNTLSFTIQDTGLGIPKDQREKIFQKFHRSSNVKGRFEGTGLGLYFVKLLVEQLQGSIRVESTENIGTSFIVEIPYYSSRKE